MSQHGWLRTTTKCRGVVALKAQMGRLDHMENANMSEDRVEGLLHEAGTKLEASGDSVTTVEEGMVLVHRRSCVVPVETNSS